ncbi:MAG: type II toxin-antitoxin system VapC family toxin [Acidobacteria bacterium]|nr:type II toxin-antitoxin system VapC family toxin [Acidobacteriota bacterium]MBI1982733.1 type II toxin-antitoxin system VapC family toxin [Acidobacteriota bacterium]
MNGRLLLDTNAVIALWAYDPFIESRVREADRYYVPIVVLGELFHGALGSAKRESNWDRVRRFAAEVAILPCDALTAEHYARIRFQLRSKGRPIPDNDIWIAAVAQQHGLALLTRDEHFKAVDGLIAERW